MFIQAYSIKGLKKRYATWAGGSNGFKAWSLIEKKEGEHDILRLPQRTN